MDAQVAVALAALAVSLGSALWTAWSGHRQAEAGHAQALRQQEIEEEQVGCSGR